MCFYVFHLNRVEFLQELILRIETYFLQGIFLCLIIILLIRINITFKCLKNQEES